MVGVGLDQRLGRRVTDAALDEKVEQLANAAEADGKLLDHLPARPPAHLRVVLHGDAEGVLERRAEGERVRGEGEQVAHEGAKLRHGDVLAGAHEEVRDAPAVGVG